MAGEVAYSGGARLRFPPPAGRISIGSGMFWRRRRRWRLHLGAHKTATTHLQDVLEANRDRLLTLGVGYVPRDAIRYGWIPDMKAVVEGSLPPAAAARQIVARTSALRGRAETVVMSEENWLGPAGETLTDPIYPDLGARIAALAALQRHGPLTLFLAVRRWDEFLASSYATAIRFGAIPGGFGPIRERALRRPPRWSDVVARIRAAAPGVELLIWRYEDYRHNAAPIMDALCGRGVGPLADLPDPARTRTPSARAVAAAETFVGPTRWEERHKLIDAIYQRDFVDGDGGKYAPFEPAEAATLREAYDEDWAAIPAALKLPLRS